MKLLTYSHNGKEYPGILSEDGTNVIPFSAFGLTASDLNELIPILHNGALSDIQKQLSALTKLPPESLPFSEVTLCAPIPVPLQDILCLGINYAAHEEEAARYKKEAFSTTQEHAIYFSKRVNRATAHEEDIPSHKNLVERLDYESELALVLGQDICNLPPEEAYSAILGYTIINDISARDVQTRHKQWYFGKSLDGFCPMGPWIVSSDEFKLPPELNVRSRVNGELRQNSNTRLMIHDIPEVLSELSQGMTLKAGTIISMGTPAGVGMGFTPPKFLKPGDIVECEIEGIGVLRNRII